MSIQDKIDPSIPSNRRKAASTSTSGQQSYGRARKSTGSQSTEKEIGKGSSRVGHSGREGKGQSLIEAEGTEIGGVRKYYLFLCLQMRCDYTYLHTWLYLMGYDHSPKNILENITA